MCFEIVRAVCCSLVYLKKTFITIVWLCRYVITGGEDSDVRVYEDIDDDSCTEFSVASEKVTAIVCWMSKDRVCDFVTTPMFVVVV